MRNDQTRRSLAARQFVNLRLSTALGATSNSEKLSIARAKAHTESLGTLSTDGGLAGRDTTRAGMAIS
jgi:hypothetical protein